MSTDKLVPNDPRVKYESTQVNGKTYSYVLGEPTTGGESKGLVFLVHGFPDLSFGWRYQVPYLTSRGYRVVVPDQLGYGGTDAPAAAEEYTLKKLSDDVAALARKLVGDDGQIILGGHDWGGALVWRVALWHPDLLRGVFSVCTPFSASNPQFFALEDIIAAGKLTNFTYQLHFKGPEVEEKIQGEDKVKQFLNCMFGGHGANGERGFDTAKGVLFDNLDKLSKTRLLSEEELNHYVERYMAHPAPQLRGPLNWYRTQRLNWEDEKELAGRPGGVKIETPALFIAASGDEALPPSMSAGMDKYFGKLSRDEVNASHWALTQAPGEVNKSIGAWLDELDGGAKASL
ncbi:Bifunctional epoxide hydrolase-like protein [Hapsidospora chrysogenum ATCC 11550]|uniref:Bifunctional epoxide hydrolase-like protein n=1 Tax=Hapsidospora chrysogenum (strain ATCC 11550 / CBS 779.69 / DSM 880 / IAM 14645 / JCM 23072 / IMI 49137) TaxID=857340 RepID=A0A086TI50_HAPC1|nr:Bifunctional epoxide hydrolase-like protein [Hapsidospora chrysogenum ATCC 11550]